MDLLQKSSLTLRLVFLSILPLSSFSSLPLFKAASLKCVKRVPVFLFSLILLCLLGRPAFLDASPVHVPQSLKSLKISAFKRELRMPKPGLKTSPHDERLYVLYRQNRFQEVLQTFDQLVSDQKNGRTFILYGNSLLLLGQTSRSVAAFQMAFQKSDGPPVKSAAMANFALVFSMSKRWPEAVGWLEKALEIDREADDWRAQGLALSQLGVYYFKLGDAQKGASAHIEALEIAETVPIPWLEARQLGQLASLYYRDQTLPLARDYYQQALKIYKTLNDPLGEAGTLSALSFVYKDLGDFDTALSLQLKALKGYEKLEDEGNRSKIWLNLSLLYRDQGRYPEALHAAKEALRLQMPSKNVSKLAEIEGTIGTIYEKKGELSEALRHLKKARTYFEKTGASQEIHIVDLRIQTLEDQMP